MNKDSELRKLMIKEEEFMQNIVNPYNEKSKRICDEVKLEVKKACEKFLNDKINIRDRDNIKKKYDLL